jgi:hypothetical protein
MKLATKNILYFFFVSSTLLYVVRSLHMYIKKLAEVWNFLLRENSQDIIHKLGDYCYVVTRYAKF